jgi:inhibitor of cysteine peptidase
MIREGPPSRVTTSGEPVEVALPESPTTGYRWELEDDGQAVRILSARYDEEPDPVRTAGGGGTRTFRIELLDPRPTEVRFVLRRPWDPQPIERRVVTIIPTDR